MMEVRKFKKKRQQGQLIAGRLRHLRGGQSGKTVLDWSPDADGTGESTYYGGVSTGGH